MKTALIEYTVKDITKNFYYNELEGKGVFGLAGTLVIQPEYQRNYIYAEQQERRGCNPITSKRLPAPASSTSTMLTGNN